MDLYTRKALNIYPQNEEPFYHGSAYSPDNMVCEGSDNELTDEELREKRLRYEDHAQKYMRGCLPILQSARLRGPLEDRSEWSNPWRFQPSELRAKKDTSQARAELTSRNGGEQRSSRSFSERWGSSFASSSEIRGTNSSLRTMGHGDIIGFTEGQHRKASIRTSSRRENSGDEAPTASYSASGISEQERRTDATRQKRSGDSQWLKGSYVSKRARWNDTAVDTPTPNPHVYNQRTHRKILSNGPSRGAASGHSSSHSRNSFPNIVSQKAPVESQETSGLNRTIELSRSVFHHVLPSGQSSSTSHGQQLHSESSHFAQPPSSNYSSPGYDSSSAFIPGQHFRKSRLESQADRTPDFAAIYSSIPNPISTTSSLPKLSKPALFVEQGQNTPEVEVSFVTEVAPSSRYLEEFKYKKRRSKGSLSASASENSKIEGSKSQRKPNARNASDRAADEPGLRYSQQDTSIKHESNDEDDENEDVLASGPYRHWYEAIPAKDMPTMGTGSQYDRSGISQNSGVDAPSNSRIVDDNTTKIHPEIGSIPQDSLVHPSSSQVTSKTHNSSKHTITLDKTSTYSSMQHEVPTPKHILSRPLGIDGSSTQSHNTTPAKLSGTSLLPQSPFEALQISTESHSGRTTSGKSLQIGDESILRPRQESARSSHGNIVYDEKYSLRHSVGTNPSSPVMEKPAPQHQENRNKNTPPSVTGESQILAVSIASSGSVTSKSATPKVQSQVIGSTEQSPWARTDVQPLHKLSSKLSPTTNPVVTITSSESWGSVQQTSLDSKDVESDWQSSDHQATPENDGIRLFSEMVTPPPPSRPSSSIHQLGTTDSQQIVAGAVNNPWNSANKPSAKSNKRVSFGILFDSSTDRGCEHQPKRLGGSPPPPNSIENLDKEDGFDTDMVVPKFTKHFSVFKEPRGLSQHDSISVQSPSIGAMAEAFIAADQDMSVEEECRRRLSEIARHLKPSSPSMVNAVRRESVGFSSSHLSDADEDSPSKDVEPDSKDAGFDMADALGGFADFLGDWSVEGELQKARNASQKSVESNGAKRRRLFAIV
jgi:hypothetical protein